MSGMKTALTPLMRSSIAMLGIASLLTNACTGIITNDDKGGSISASLSAGTIPDSLTVSRFGNADYKIPIEVPAGLGDVMPSLSLNYSSGGSNGTLGMGFSLGGIPRIGRCFETVAADGHRFAIQYNDKDRFCLNGQKLTVLNKQKRDQQRNAYGKDGTTYGTEIESLRHIVSKGRKGDGPDHFDAWYPGLLNYKFGNTPNSALMQAGREEVLAWSASRVEDLSGNYMEFHYEQELGMSYPKSISYGGNTVAGTPHFAEIQFSYEIRPDPSVTYIGNEKAHRQQRLKSITTRVGGELVRRYSISYEQSALNGRSRISSISLCSQDVCLPATTLNWQEGEDRYTEIDTQIDSSLAQSTQWADINGDGRPDMLFPQGGTWRVRFAKTNGIGFQAPVDTGAETRGVSTPTGTVYPVHTFNADGDGRRDILFPNGSTDSWNIARYRNGEFEIRDTEIGDARYEHGAVATMGDLNGDGRDEVLGLDNYYPDLRVSSDNMSYLYGWPLDNYRGILVTMSPADFNGDGLMDVAIGSKESGSPGKRSLHLTVPKDPDVFVLGQTELPLPLVKVLEMNRNFGYLKPDALRHATRLEGQSLDLNGDGFSDYLIAVKAEGRGNNDYVWEIRMGTTSFREAEGWLELGPAKTWRPVVVDLNSDGQNELLFPSESSTWTVIEAGSMASQETMMKSTSFSKTFPIDDGFLLAMDMDGDGLQDFLTHTDNTWKVHRREGEIPNLLTSIENGLGEKTTLKYAPLSDRSVHTPVDEDTLSYPTRSFNTSSQVVRKIQRSSGNRDDAGLFATMYRYEGARANILGRGFLGFSKQTIEDHRRGVRISRSMKPSWPFQGMLVREEVRRLQDSKMIESTDYTLQKRGCEIEDCDAVSPNGFPGAVHPVVVKEVKLKYSEDGNSTLSQTTTNRTYSLERLMIEETIETQRGQTISKTAKESYSRFSEDQRFAERKFAGLAGVVWKGSSTTESASNLTTVRDQRVNYNALGLVTRKTSGSEGIGAYHSVWEYQHDVFGNVIDSLMTSNRLATAVEDSYSDDGRFLLTSKDTNELGYVTTREYDPRHGLLTKEVAPDGSTASFAYDGLGNTTIEVDAYGNTSTWTRLDSQHGMTINTRRTSAPDTVETLDILGRTRELATERLVKPGITATSIVRTDYDALGRLKRRSVPNWGGHSPVYEEFQYDTTGRQTLHKKANGTTTKTEYEDYSTLVTINGNTAAPQIHRSERDSRDRVILRESAAGTIRYTFGPFDTLLNVVDPDGNSIVMEYDAMGRRTKLVDPDMGEWIFEYTREGREARRIRPDGSSISQDYDLIGRILIKGYWNEESSAQYTLDYSYDESALGKLDSVVGQSYEGLRGESREDYSYNEQGSLISKTRTWANREVAPLREEKVWDDSGRVQSVSLSSGNTIGYQYSSSGELLSMKHGNDKVWEALLFDANGNLLKERFGNGVETHRTIDPATGYTLDITTGGGSIQDLAYEYDGFGNLLARHDLRSGQIEEFEYDSLDRLVRVILDGMEAETIRYDKLGNISQRSSVGDFRYDGPQPHAVTQAGEANYIYDQEGRMTSGDGSTIKYNAISKPSEVKMGDLTSGFVYAPDDRQTLSESVVATETNYSVNQYYGDLWERSEYSAGDTEVRTRIRISGANGVKALWVGSERQGAMTEELLYYHTDHLGSVDAISDASGSVRERQSFSPFGSRREQDWKSPGESSAWEEAVDSRGFTGHPQFDHMQLVYMGARMYSPKLGRFISPDTIIQAPENSQSLNRYSYVFNNPLSYTDPTGHVAEGLNSQGHDEFAGVEAFFSSNNTSTFMSGGWGFLCASPVVSDSPKSEEFEGREPVGERKSVFDFINGSLKFPFLKGKVGSENWTLSGYVGLYDFSVQPGKYSLGMSKGLWLVTPGVKIVYENGRISGFASVSVSAQSKKIPMFGNVALPGLSGGSQKELFNLGVNDITNWMNNQYTITPTDKREYSRTCGGFGGGGYCQ